MSKHAILLKNKDIGFQIIQTIIIHTEPSTAHADYKVVHTIAWIQLFMTCSIYILEKYSKSIQLCA